MTPAASVAAVRPMRRPVLGRDNRFAMIHTRKRTPHGGEAQGREMFQGHRFYLSWRPGRPVSGEGGSGPILEAGGPLTRAISNFHVPCSLDE